jgi:hypothetical protein
MKRCKTRVCQIGLLDKKTSKKSTLDLGRLILGKEIAEYSKHLFSLLFSYNNSF